MNVLMLVVLRGSVILGVLQESPAEDQFGEEVQWSTFASKPFVMVFADRESSESGKSIGTALHRTFNGDYTAPEKHLHTSSPHREHQDHFCRGSA
jgi:hypothetical protein